MILVLSTVATDALVPMHQAISIHSAEWIFVVLDMIDTEIVKDIGNNNKQ